MYRIRLLVEGHAKEYFPGGQQFYDLELESPATVRQMIRELGVSPDLVMSVFIKGRLVDKDYVPPDGAEVVLITPPAGG